MQFEQSQSHTEYSQYNTDLVCYWMDMQNIELLL